jgi:hypothetical protein
MNHFDTIIIGGGVAGVFACLRLSEKHRDMKVLCIEAGRGPAKRRHQLYGYFGSFPAGDGKLFLSDVPKVAALTSPKKAKIAYNWVKDVLSNVNDFEVTKDRSPSISVEKKLKKSGYKLSLNDYIQTHPKDVHALSKYTVDIFDKNKNITFSFDNEVQSICKQRGTFIITTEGQEYKCKKVIIAVGRGGWRWAKTLYSNLGLIENNDIARFGIRVEMNASIMKDFNKSNCTITKDDLEIGPLSWGGTVIPEDHGDLAISAFRSNEARWKSDKVSFTLIGKKSFPDKGVEQTDRLGKLTFILSNDRILKERVSYILAGKSKISIIPEYDWLKDTIKELAAIIPEIGTKAYFHVPAITPMAPQVNVSPILETELEGMFVMGESAGVHGILAAACMGQIVANGVYK